LNVTFFIDLKITWGTEGGSAQNEKV